MNILSASDAYRAIYGTLFRMHQRHYYNTVKAPANDLDGGAVHGRRPDPFRSGDVPPLGAA